MAVAAAAGLTLGACGGDDDEPEASDAGAGSVTATASDETAAPGDAVITIETFAFGGVTEVPAGTTVTVVNNDSATHTWTSTDGAFDSDSIAPGESFQITLDEPGTYPYFCAFHSQMSGTITVTA